MSTNVTSTNPLVQAIVAGTAPQAAQLMAARGLLPLAPSDLLEALVALRASEAEEVRRAADETLAAQDAEGLREIATDNETAPSVLAYLAERPDLTRDIHEPVVLNRNTPDTAIVTLARQTSDAGLLELIAINQQRLIRAPQIIEAVLDNAARSGEAERRVREVQREFFEKELGARRVAEELRARGETAAAEFIETAESIDEGTLPIEDAWLIAQHIEVSDADVDDSWLPMELIEEFYEETIEQRAANAERIIVETSTEAVGADIAPERVALIRRIMLMTVKDRIKLGLKGDREARAILIRDSNKVVSTAVIRNPRITDQEVEAISAMRTVSDEVLRLIGMNRQWARSYAIIHNLARNPRTPLPTAMTILSRLRPGDLKSLTQNRNVSESVRRQAYRLTQTRAGH